MLIRRAIGVDPTGIGRNADISNIATRCGLAHCARTTRPAKVDNAALEIRATNVTNALIGDGTIRGRIGSSAGLSRCVALRTLADRRRIRRIASCRMKRVVWNCRPVR